MSWEIPQGAEPHLYAFLGVGALAVVLIIHRMVRPGAANLRPLTLATLWLAAWTGLGLVLRMIGYA